MLINPRNMKLQLFRGVIIFLTIDRLKFTAINRHNDIGKHVHLTTKTYKFPAGMLDAITIIPSEISYRFKVRSQASQ